MVYQEKLLSLRVGIAVVAMTLSAVATSSERSERATLAACRKAEQQGQVLRAFSALRRLVKSKHVYIRQEAQFLLGKAYLTGKKPREAEEIWNQLAGEDSPRWTRASWFALADLYRTEKQFDQAMATYARILKGNEIDALVIRAAAAVGDIRLALKEHVAAAEAYKYALRVAKQVYDEDKHGLDLKAISRSHDLARRALAIKSKGEDEVLYEDAKRLQAGKRFKQARAKYDEVLARFPESVWCDPSTVGVGRCFVEEWNIVEAFRILRPFVKTAPQGPYRAQALIGLGDAELFGHCRGEAALQLYRKAVEPPAGAHASWRQARWEAEQRLGIVLFATGDKEAARAHFEAARGHIPRNSAAATRSLGLLSIVRNFCLQVDGPKLTPAFLLREGGRDTRLALVLGDIWHEILDFEKALRTYALVLDRRKLGARATPEQIVHALMMTALCHQNMFQAEKAIRMYRTILKEYPRTRQRMNVMWRLSTVMYNQTENYRESAEIDFKIAQMPGLDRNRREQALYRGAWTLASKGHLADARRVLAAMKRSCPNSSWTSVLEFEMKEFEAEFGRAMATKLPTGGNP